MTQARVCPVCPECVSVCPGRTSSLCVRVSLPLQGGHTRDTLDSTTHNPQVCPDALASVGLPFGWLEADDRRRAALMAAGKQRLALSRKRRR
jgi:hypothetical protein